MRSPRPTVTVWSVAVGGRLVMLSTTLAFTLCRPVLSVTLNRNSSVPEVRVAAVYVRLQPAPPRAPLPLTVEEGTTQVNGSPSGSVPVSVTGTAVPL